MYVEGFTQSMPNIASYVFCGDLHFFGGGFRREGLNDNDNIWGGGGGGVSK